MGTEVREPGFGGIALPTTSGEKSIEAGQLEEASAVSSILMKGSKPKAGGFRKPTLRSHFLISCKHWLLSSIPVNETPKAIK